MDSGWEFAGSSWCGPGGAGSGCGLICGLNVCYTIKKSPKISPTDKTHFFRFFETPLDARAKMKIELI